MQIKAYIVTVLILFRLVGIAQLANYVSNGGFEEIYECVSSAPRPVNWLAFDSTKTLAIGGINICTCSGQVPYCNYGFQYPRSGYNFMATNLWCGIQSCFLEKRMNLKNRLKTNLDSGVTYCVKFYVVATNYSPYHTSAIGAHFGGTILDTISWTGGNRPLPFIVPQVKNPLTNYINDTLNWLPITGTFVAIGDEKYMLIGNFEPSPFTYTLLANPNQAATDGVDIYIDHVSCIPIDLPAYAGPDKRCIPGDSVFIGRTPDVEIDESCTWYKWPNMATPIATVAGLYVKPVTTTTYVVLQQLWCSGVKYDTVVVYEDAVGLNKLKIKNEELKISPSPATNEIMLSLAHGKLSSYFERIEILNTQGLVLKEILISNDATKLEISVTDLESGVYLLRLMDAEKERVVVKKMVLQR